MPNARMECAAAFIGVAIADIFILRGKDDSRGNRISVDINASKNIPSDANWSPATASTMLDDEMSAMSDEEGYMVSPMNSKVLRIGGYAPHDQNGVKASAINVLENDGVEQAAAGRIQRTFRSFRCSRRMCQETATCRQHTHTVHPRNKSPESPKKPCQRPEKRVVMHNPRSKRLLRSHEQLNSYGRESRDGKYVQRSKQNSMTFCARKENFSHSFTGIGFRKHKAAISIQSHVRGYIARALFKQMRARQHNAAISIQSYFRRCIIHSWQQQKRIRQHGAAVSIQSQVSGRIALSSSVKKLRMKGREREIGVSFQSHLHGCRAHSSRKISRTTANTILDSPSAMSKEEWKENHWKMSIKSISSKLQGKIQIFPIRTGAQDASSVESQNDFRSVLSFWESMAIKSQQRTDKNRQMKRRILWGKSIGAIETNDRNKQQKALETTSATRIQTFFRCYWRKKLRCNAAIQIQRQVRFWIPKQKVVEAGKKPQHSHVAHINSKKIREFVTRFSETSSTPQLVKDCIATSFPLAREKLSFFEPSLVLTQEVGQVEHPVTSSIQEEEFWKTQRVILQQRPCCRELRR